MPKGAEQREEPEWLSAAAELARQLSCDASLQLGASVETCADVQRLLEVAFSCVHGWHPDRQVAVWEDAFAVVVAAWSGKIAPDVVNRAIESLWSDIRRGRDGLDQKSDLARFSSQCFLYGLSVSALGGVQTGLARHLAERSGSDQATERRSDEGAGTR